MNPAAVFATHAVAGDVASRESLRQCAIYTVGAFGGAAATAVLARLIGAKGRTRGGRAIGDEVERATTTTTKAKKKPAAGTSKKPAAATTSKTKSKSKSSRSPSSPPRRRAAGAAPAETPTRQSVRRRKEKVPMDL
jgi:2-methylcitrate dehydratase PrpD